MNKSSNMEYKDKANESFFDRWAKKYDDTRITTWFQYTQELTIGFLNLHLNSKVLDVGCGTGYAVLKLASILMKVKVCGIDISSVMIEKARAKVPDNMREKVEFKKASSNSIPYHDNEFDHVICTNTFHHYRDPIIALREMQRVLKPGGQIVIFENAPDLSLYTWAWDRIFRVIEKGHIRYCSSKELGEMLTQAEFENATQCYLKNEFLKHGKLFASVQVWSGQKPVNDKVLEKQRGDRQGKLYSYCIEK